MPRPRMEILGLNDAYPEIIQIINMELEEPILDHEATSPSLFIDNRVDLITINKKSPKSIYNNKVNLTTTKQQCPPNSKPTCAKQQKPSPTPSTAAGKQVSRCNSAPQNVRTAFYRPPSASRQRTTTSGLHTSRKLHPWLLEAQ